MAHIETVFRTDDGKEYKAELSTIAAKITLDTGTDNLVLNLGMVYKHRVGTMSLDIPLQDGYMVALLSKVMDTVNPHLWSGGFDWSEINGKEIYVLAESDTSYGFANVKSPSRYFLLKDVLPGHVTPTKNSTISDKKVWNFKNDS